MNQIEYQERLSRIKASEDFKNRTINKISQIALLNPNAENIPQPGFQYAASTKSAIGKRIIFAAAVAAAVAALSGIALAAVLGFDFGRIYNSFFNNPAAEYRIEVGRTVTSDGLDITLLSAFTDGNQVYALVELIDTEGGRLSDSIRAVSDYFKHRSIHVSTGAVVFDETENRALLTLALSLGRQVGVGDHVVFHIDYVLSGIGHIDNELLDFDIAAHAINNETVSRDEWFEIAGNAIRLSAYAGDGGMSHAMGHPAPDVALLMPGDMDAAIDGINWAVMSNAGVVDGMLHLQFKRTESYNWHYNSGYFILIDGAGNEVPSFFTAQIGDYEELVYELENARDLAALSLAVSGEQIGNYMLGPWEMSFTVDSEMPKKTLTVFPPDSPYLAKLEITCSPMTTSIRFATVNAALSENDTIEFTMSPIEQMEAFTPGMIANIESFGQPYLTLDDGSIIYLEYKGGGYGFYDGAFDYASVYFDIDRLYSITFCGEVYLFTAMP